MPPAIDRNNILMTLPPDSWTETCAAAPPPPQLNICVFSHMQLNRAVDGTHDC